MDDEKLSSFGDSVGSCTSELETEIQAPSKAKKVAKDVLGTLWSILLTPIIISVYLIALLFRSLKSLVGMCPIFGACIVMYVEIVFYIIFDLVDLLTFGRFKSCLRYLRLRYYFEEKNWKRMIQCSKRLEWSDEIFNVYA